MENIESKPKSFLQSFTWIATALMIMGGVFLAIAIVIQLIPLNPEHITVNIDGVRQTSTEETLDMFRWIFLLSFGIPGSIMLVAGGIVAGQKVLRDKRDQRLKEDGVRVTAEVTGFENSFLRVNHQRLPRLQCAYKTLDGKTYIFKSRLLRLDPSAYLKDSKVQVYYDKDNMKRYFVDVDGSVGVGEKVIEV